MGIYFLNDTNSGIYRPGADEVQIVVGGVERVGAAAQGLKLNTLGSVSAPGIFINGDTNTGLYFGVDEVGITTGGIGRILADANGNVGVGTGTPLAAVQVTGPAINLTGASTVVNRGLYVSPNPSWCGQYPTSG